MSRYSRTAAVLLLFVGLAEPAFARQDTLYMSVLNSRKHRLGALDNPTVGLFMSPDGGATWQHKGWTGYIRTFYTEAGPDGVLWSACGNGVLRSSDHGLTWRITTGWEITEALKVKVDPKNPSIVYAATAYGVFRSENSGETWTRRNHGFVKPFVSDIVVDRANTHRLLAASEDGLYESTNSGRSWKKTGMNGRGIRTIVQDPGNVRLFYAGTEDDGFFASSNAGKTWTASNNGLTNPTVYAIACDPSAAGTLYAGTHGGGVYRSLDGGKQWHPVNDGLTNLVVHAIVVLSSNPSMVLAGTLNGGLFKSTDRGGRWNFNSQEEAQVWGLWVR
jgi:photosystem II stability/assembly factor-like uncharacterized protein